MTWLELTIKNVSISCSVKTIQKYTLTLLFKGFDKENGIEANRRIVNY